MIFYLQLSLTYSDPVLLYFLTVYASGRFCDKLNWPKLDFFDSVMSDFFSPYRVSETHRHILSNIQTPCHVIPPLGNLSRIYISECINKIGSLITSLIHSYSRRHILPPLHLLLQLKKSWLNCTSHVHLTKIAYIWKCIVVKLLFLIMMYVCRTQY